MTAGTGDPQVAAAIDLAALQSDGEAVTGQQRLARIIGRKHRFEAEADLGEEGRALGQLATGKDDFGGVLH